MAWAVRAVIKRKRIMAALRATAGRSAAEMVRRIAPAWRAPPLLRVCGGAAVAAAAAAPSHASLRTALAPPLRAWWAAPRAGKRTLALQAAGVHAEGGRAAAAPAHQPPADPAREADLRDVLELLDEKKAMDVVVLRADDIERMRTLCDHMVILTCTSRRHMKIVADHVVDHFRLKGMLVEVEDDDGNVMTVPPSVEDANSEEWMLVDLGHIIVQILSREGRDKVRRVLAPLALPPRDRPLPAASHALSPDRARCAVLCCAVLC